MKKKILGLFHPIFKKIQVSIETKEGVKFFDGLEGKPCEKNCNGVIKKNETKCSKCNK